jgi:D-glycero-alpha-D-manno-heptose-7-phosphate kinase
MSELVHQAVAVLNRDRPLREFGELLHEAWLAKRSLSQVVTNADVDSIYDAARAAGALGGKLTGAGGGGFMLLFAPPECQAKIREQLRKLLLVPFKFDYHGSQIIFFDPDEDYAEAHRDRDSRPIESFRELTPPAS